MTRERSFGRVAVVEVGTLGGATKSLPCGGRDGFRLYFDVGSNGSSAANTAEIRIWGLGDATAALFGKSGAYVRLLAGYEDRGPIQLFEGTVSPGTYSDQWMGRDRIVKVGLRDGGDALRETYVSISLPGRVRYSDVLEAVRQDLGLARGSVALGEDVVLSRGWHYVGPARRALAEIAKTTGSRVLVSDGRLVAFPRNGKRRDRVQIIGPETGLVGSPRVTASGFEAQLLLAPDLRVGDRARFNARDLKGSGIVRSVRHVGDTHGDGPTWTSKIKGIKA